MSRVENTLFACKRSQAINIFFQHGERIFNRLCGGHIHARDLENFNRRFRRTCFEKVDVIFCRSWDAGQNPFGDGIRGGNPDRVLEGVVIDLLGLLFNK